MQPEMTDAVSYVQTHLAQGYNAQQIRDHFISSGWTEDQVTQLFAHVSPSPAPPLAAPAMVAPQPVVSTMQPATPIVAPQPEPPAVVSGGPVAPDAASLQSIYPQPTAPQSFGPQPAMTAASAAASATPTKYGVFHALGDTLKAIRTNFASYVLSLLIGIGLYAGIIILLTATIAGMEHSQSILGGAGASILGIIFIIVLILIALPVVNTVTGIMLALSVDAGAQGIKSHIGAIFSHGLQKTLHVILVSLLTWIMLFTPFVIAIIVTIAAALSALSGNNTSAGMLALYPILLLASIVWAIIVALRLALTQPVAIFESEIGVIASLKRSSFLLRKGGQWFVFKGLLLLFAVGIPLNYFTSGNGSVTSSQAFVANILIILISLLAENVLVLLYRNRVVVRGGQTAVAQTNSPAPQAPQAVIAES